MDDVTIAPEAPRQPEVLALLERAWAFSEALYPAESNHHLDLAALEKPELTFFVARRASRPLGCGAVMLAGGDAGELKSVFVDEGARGLKIGRRLLGALEDFGAQCGLAVLRLETGIRQPEAIGLYTSAGYVMRGPFGDYLPDPLSLFMEKTLR